jgi:hypothetical protein
MFKQFRRGKDHASAFATIHERPFPRIHYCPIGLFPSVDYIPKQTNGRPSGHFEDYRADGPEVSSDNDLQQHVSDMSHVGLHGRAEITHLSAFVEISSC